MKIAFLGTPDFALPSLKMLYERGDEIGRASCRERV